MNKKILKQAGLTDLEIDVYLTLLRLGSIVVSKIISNGYIELALA